MPCSNAEWKKVHTCCVSHVFASESGEGGVVVKLSCKVHSWDLHGVTLAAYTARYVCVDRRGVRKWRTAGKGLRFAPKTASPQITEQNI